MNIAMTILLIVAIVLVFWYTGKSSVKHNKKIISWLKHNNDKSEKWLT